MNIMLNQGLKIWVVTCSLTGRLAELVDVMVRRNVSILCVQDTKWVGEKARIIELLGYKLWYTGREKIIMGWV